MGKRSNYEQSPTVSLSPCSISPISFVGESISLRESPCLGFGPPLSILGQCSCSPISAPCVASAVVPRELWREILGFLSTAGDLFRCRLVNKKWSGYALVVGNKRKDFLAALAVGQRARRKFISDEVARRALGELVRVKELSMGSTPPYISNRSRGTYSISPRTAELAAEFAPHIFEGLPNVEELNSSLLGMCVTDQISMRVDSLNQLMPLSKGRRSRRSSAHPWQGQMLDCCKANMVHSFPFSKSGRRYYVEANPAGSESPFAGSPSAQEQSQVLQQKTNCERSFRVLWQALEHCQTGDEIVLAPGQHGGSLKAEIVPSMAPFPHAPQHAPVTIWGKNVVLISAQLALQEAGEQMELRESILIPNESWKVETLVDVSFACVSFRGVVFCGGDLTLYEGLLRVHTHGCVSLEGCILDFAGSGGGVVIEDGAFFAEDCVLANSAGEAVSVNNVGGACCEGHSSVCVLRRSKFISNGMGDFCCPAGAPAVRISARAHSNFEGEPLVLIEACEFMNNTGPDIEVTSQAAEGVSSIWVNNCRKEDGGDANVVISVVDTDTVIGDVF